MLTHSRPYRKCIFGHLLKLSFALCGLSLTFVNSYANTATEQITAKPARTPVHALYIPLADHYAALVAYERYGKTMRFADFRLSKMKNWDLLRAAFEEGQADMAFVMSPLALDMFHRNANFKWIGLMHRDGNALALNSKIAAMVPLSAERKNRLPNDSVARALKHIYEETGRPTPIGMPHLLSTHTVVLHEYLKQNGLNLSLSLNRPAEVLAIPVAPPLAPAYLRKNSNTQRYAAFEQSLPWADVVETQGFGKVAWYSKDVLQWPKGHVECIAIANNQSLDLHFNAIHEVMFAIHKAGADIEQARLQGGAALEDIVRIVRKHIPAHTEAAIIASLNPELRVINYQDLNIDIEGIRLIMDIAVRGGILKSTVDLEAFADKRFHFSPQKLTPESTLHEH